MTPIDVQFTWSKVKVKLLVFEQILCLKFSKLGAMDAPSKEMFPVDVQVK